MADLRFRILLLRKHFTTPAFPPKRVQCSQPKVLEQRRQVLEHYLQTMMKFGPSRTQIMSFLGISDSISESINTADTNVISLLDGMAANDAPNERYLCMSPLMDTRVHTLLAT